MEIARNQSPLETESTGLVKLHMVSAGLQSGKSEQYANRLRANGIAIESLHVNSVQEFELTLQSSRIDLVLCDGASADIPLETIIYGVQQYNPEASVVAAGDSTILEQHAFGVADIIDPDNETESLHRLNRVIQLLLASRKIHDLEQQCRSFETRSQMLLDTSKEAICYTHAGMHVFANPSYLELFGISQDDDDNEIESITLMDLVESDYHRDLKRMLKLSQHANEKEYSLEVSCKRLDGETFTADMTFSPVIVDEERSVQVIVRHKDEETPSAMPNIDLLSGLFSSNYFQGTASEIVEATQQSGKVFALYYIAIDRYMQIRESVGLRESNTIIKEIAEILGSALSAEMRKTLARIGDHAFAFIAPTNSDRSLLQKVAERLVTLVEKHPFEQIPETSHPRISIGVALSDHEKIEDGSDFIDQAYHAYSSVAESEKPIAIYGESTSQSEEPTAAPPAPVVSSDEADTVDLVKYALENEKIGHKLIAMLNLDGDDPMQNYLVDIEFSDDNGVLTPYSEISEAVYASGKAALVDNLLLNKIAELHSASSNEKDVFYLPLSPASFSDENFIQRLDTLLTQHNLKSQALSFVLDGKDIRQHLGEAKTFCQAIQETGSTCYVSGFGERDDDLALIREISASGVWFASKLSEGFSGSDTKLQRIKDLTMALKSLNRKTILGNINSPSVLANAWGIGVNFITGPFLHKGSEKPDFDFSRYN
jgi:diguanylate cyclase (GGDEF)-like protein/PAS domain S-box-containing protein